MMGRGRAGLLVLIGMVSGLLYSSFLIDAALPGPHHWNVVVSELALP